VHHDTTPSQGADTAPEGHTDSAVPPGSATRLRLIAGGVLPPATDPD
jgi:hypothetical protein